MNLPVAVGTKDLESIGCRNYAQLTSSSSRPKISAFWWTKKATKVHTSPAVDTTNLETKHIVRSYVPPTHSSRPQVSVFRSPAPATPTRRTNLNFLLATPALEIRRAHNISSRSSPVTPLELLLAHYRSAPLSPPPMKRKVITVDQIKDRDLQRLQIPIIQEFYLQNMDSEGDERANPGRKWRLQPRPNPRSHEY